MKSDTIIIGCNFFGHNSSIFAILPGSEKIFGIQTERLSRYKHDQLPPIEPLKRIISYESLDVRNIDRVVFCHMSLGAQNDRFPENLYEREIAIRKHTKTRYKKDVEVARSKYDRLSLPIKIIHSVKNLSGLYLLWTAIARKIGSIKVISGDQLIRQHLEKIFPFSEIEVHYYDHEYCHSLSALVTSGFKDVVSISIDGWGEDYFSRVFTLQQGEVRQLADSSTGPKNIDIGSGKVIRYSIGAIYEYFTDKLGFSPGSDEGKVEALAAYGSPVKEMLEELVASVSFSDDLAIVLDQKRIGSILNEKDFEKLLTVRKKEDLAATVQSFLEAIMVPYVRAVVEKTGIRNIALAGGVSANVINNMRIFEEVSQNLHIIPAMADDGAAQGAAYAYLLENGAEIDQLRSFTNEMPYYSTSFDRSAVKATLETHTDSITVQDMGAEWPEKVAELVAGGQIGALFHGKMEWGPRALGNRSIIADARRKDFRDKINKEIKRRPLFQPFCPSMLDEEKDRLFKKVYSNKHMTCAFHLKEEYRDLLPSAIHIDGTARVQFVEEKDNPNYYRVLKRVKELTGYGVVINTSFNKHGRTIVESPEDAVTDFLDTDMDYMAIEGYLVTKKMVKSADM